MIMKRFYIPLCLLLTLGVMSCRKEEKIDFKFNDELNYVSTELDNWLAKNFTDTYNMDVVYRFDRYKIGELKPNLMPAKEEKVKEQMEMVLKGFLLPFQTAGGVPFVKTYAPKEWVLSGSFNVTSDGRILATSGGGRNITIYEVNSLEINNPDIVRPKLKTVHHEFSHTLTQIKRLPIEFEKISEGNYSEGWRSSSLYPDALNDAQGFVSRYARSSVMEDFAETAGFLLAEGQLWYDTKAGRVPSTGYDILKKKEATLVKYYKDNYGVDFRKLQREVALAMYNDFNDKKKQSFEYWFFDQGTFNRSLSFNTASVSADVKSAVDKFKAAVLAYSPSAKYVVQDLTFTFTPTTNNPATGNLVVSVPYRSGTTPIVFADYNFTYVQDPVTHKITFTKSAQGTGANYTNATFFMPFFTTHITSYLTSGNFIQDWSLDKPSLTRRDEGFFDTGGFYKESDRSSYLNFQLLRVRK